MGSRNDSAKKKITLKVVRNMLSNFTIPAEEVGGISGSVRQQERESLLLDKLKLAVLFFLASVLFSRISEDFEIDQALVAIVDDIDVARIYPWGRMSYCNLIKEVRNLNIKRLRSSANPQWTSCDFILPLMLLSFECIPALSPSIGRVRDVIMGQLPRICYWDTQFNLRKQAPSLSQILQVVGNSKM